ncbi:MAG: DUF7948 domain-containing protein [Candidatus Sulfotelmatobacter sp.]
MSKPAASRGWICAFYLVPLAIIAAVVLTFFPARKPDAAGTASRGSSASISQTATPASRQRIQASYASLPLAFERNQGQTDPQVKYLARGKGYTLFLTANDAVFSLHSRPAASKSSAFQDLPEVDAKSVAQRPHDKKGSTAVVHMHLVGGNSMATVQGSGPMAGTANYFLGNDPGKWRSGVARYARVSYQSVYPGVNMAFHGAERELEFDFVLAPDANPAPIGFQFTGSQGMKTDDSGNLIISSAAGDVLLHKPVAYQELNGAQQPVDARFVLKAGNQVSFELGNYDRSRELVIDPSVSYAYSTYLGGTGDDSGYGIAFDNSGNAYITGQTDSTDFPTTTGGAKGGTDVFVTKIAADGSSLIYSTYVGGTSDDSGNGIAVDASGNAYVAGGTASTNFPTTTGAFQTSLKGTTGNAFIFKLNPTSATLLYSTYLGGTGTDTAFGMAIDGSGNVYAAGRTSSSDFPLSLVSPLQATIAGGFVSKLSPAGGGASDLKFSTYLGGSASDFATSVAVGGPSSNVYVTGSTSGGSFVPTTGAVQTTFGGGSSDAFVAAINPAGNAYVYLTFLGGSDTDIGNGIAVDSTGNAYVTGQTASSNSSTTHFPLASALQTTFGGGTYDAFVTEVNPAGSAFVYSTFLGGSGVDVGANIAVDGSGNAYVTGQTASSNFTTVIPTQAQLGGANDAFVSEISAGGSALVFSTYLGGTLNEDDSGKFGAIAVDNAGANIYVTGSTLSSDFRTFSTATVYQSANAGGDDAFVVKYAQATAAPTFSLSATALSPATVSPGSSATSTVAVLPPNGFGDTVTLTCAITPVVTFGPTCGAATATTTAPATLTVHTTAPTALLHAPRNNGSFGPLYAMFLPIGGMALWGFSLRSGSRRRKLFGRLLIGLLLSALLLLPACGGGSSTTNHGTPGTPANTYTVVVSGTATGATQTGTSPSLTLIVN